MTATMLSSLNAGLHSAMAADDRVVVIGEDVLDPYGGAFKVVRGLSNAFDGRVFSTPIAEGAIAAMATGLALRGFRPVAEIMFGDFLMLAADQLVNHAAKYRWIYGDKVRVPLVVRTPMGGRRGYGPTHSQTLDKHFLGVPGLWVVAPHVLGDPGAVLRQAVDLDDPVLVIENKVTYSSPLRTAPPGYQVSEVSDRAAPFPTTWLAPDDGCDGLVLCYGGMVGPALDALSTLRDCEALSLGLVVPTQLSPTPASHLERIVAEAGAETFIHVEEATVAGGWGSEMVATLEEVRLRHGLGTFTHRRVGATDHPIPSARDQEEACLPGAADIVAAVLECF